MRSCVKEKDILDDQNGLTMKKMTSDENGWELLPQLVCRIIPNSICQTSQLRLKLGKIRIIAELEWNRLKEIKPLSAERIWICVLVKSPASEKSLQCDGAVGINGSKSEPIKDRWGLRGWKGQTQEHNRSKGR